MALRDILVCLEPSDAGDRRLRLAASLARRHQALLSAAYVLPEAIPGMPPYDGLGVAAPAGAAGIAEGSVVAGRPLPGATPLPGPAPDRAAAVADIVEQRFRAAVRPRAIEGDWHIFGPGESRDFLALVPAVDLVVCGQPSPDLRVPTGFHPADVALACGRPLLVVPYAGDFASVGRHVLVAWDGTREAARALHDALPLIGDAESVVILTVREREERFADDRPGLDRIVRHLARHGITARSEESLRGDIAISDVLLSRAADIDADLIVAGVYHHSQWREALFGGVSRELLDHMTVPVLMAH